jgi:hypothetical protein
MGDIYCIHIYKIFKKFLEVNVWMAEWLLVSVVVSNSVNESFVKPGASETCVKSL